ncbi:MAG: sugar phosphate nucleotidyltransferase [Thermodesulfovibrio sp.]
MIKGFILAAGFSKRLRPITEYIPKPLVPILGEPLLDYIYKVLKNAGINDIGINLHYKADEIERYIRENHFSLKIFFEKDILDTGGALYNAKDFLKDSIFVVHNCDIYWDGNIKEAIEWHINTGSVITLLVHDYALDNKLIVDNEGNLISIKFEKFSSNSLSSFKLLAFTGVAIYSPDILQLLPKGPSSIVDLWFNAKNKGLKVKVFPVKYSFWYDIGTPVRFAQAVFEKLRRNFTSIYVHPTSFGCDLVDAKGNLVIEKNVKIKKPFKCKNLIILPETEVFIESEYIEDCIICKNLVIPVGDWKKESESLSYGGSTRRYFRKKDKVFCEWEELGEEFKKTVLLGKFFKKKGFPVAEIFEVKKEEKLIIFEDLGNLTLYSWLQCKRKDEEILSVYKKIIEKVVILHFKISQEISKLKINLPEFDYEYFRWESNYFLKECVEDVFKLNFSNLIEDLQKELHLIAEKLSKSKKVILHRDLQSQNIMLKDDKIYFVDYQSARLGPPGYDLASLLWDPYVNLTDRVRKELINYYIEKAKNFCFSALVLNSYENFKEELCLCRIQRHMQALGAYGFLSLKRRKKNFLKFIPSALNLLTVDIKESSLKLSSLEKLVNDLKANLTLLSDTYSYI